MAYQGLVENPASTEISQVSSAVKMFYNSHHQIVHVAYACGKPIANATLRPFTHGKDSKPYSDDTNCVSHESRRTQVDLGMCRDEQIR